MALTSYLDIFANTKLQREPNSNQTRTATIQSVACLHPTNPDELAEVESCVLLHVGVRLDHLAPSFCKSASAQHSRASLRFVSNCHPLRLLFRVSLTRASPGDRVLPVHPLLCLAVEDLPTILPRPGPEMSGDADFNPFSLSVFLPLPPLLLPSPGAPLFCLHPPLCLLVALP